MKVKFNFGKILLVFFSLIFISALAINSHDQAFEKTAQKLAYELKFKLNLSQEQTKDIKSILLDYNEQIYKIMDDFRKNDKDEPADNSELTGDAEARPDLLRKYKSIDSKTNEDIEDVIGKDKVDRYADLENSWWRKVKETVFASEESYKNKNNPGSHVDPAVNADYGVEKIIVSRGNNPFDSIPGKDNRVAANDTAGTEARFRKYAKNLSIDLMKKLDLSLEQAADVRDVLVDYQKDIYEARVNNLSQSDKNNSKNKNENENEENGELVGGNNKKLLDAYKTADKKANDKIENILNKSQVQKYINIKNTWWRDVKDKIYSDEMNKYHNKLKKDQSGTDKMKNSNEKR